MSTVLIRKAEYDYQTLKPIIFGMIDASGKGLIKPGSRVLIKPNLLIPAKPEKAIPVYNSFIQQIKIDSGLKVYSGEFGAFMLIKLINEGPVTIIIDTKQKE